MQLPIMAIKTLQSASAGQIDSIWLDRHLSRGA